MRTIHKYTIGFVDEFTVEMPAGAELLCVQMQHGEPRLWALVRPDGDHTVIRHFRFYGTTVIRHFRFYGTGHIVGDACMSYVGTVQSLNGQRVFHLFEVVA